MDRKDVTQTNNVETKAESKELPPRQQVNLMLEKCLKGADDFLLKFGKSESKKSDSITTKIGKFFYGVNNLFRLSDARKQEAENFKKGIMRLQEELKGISGDDKQEVEKIEFVRAKAYGMLAFFGKPSDLIDREYAGCYNSQNDIMREIARHFIDAPTKQAVKEHFKDYYKKYDKEDHSKNSSIYSIFPAADLKREFGNQRHEWSMSDPEKLVISMILKISTDKYEAYQPKTEMEKGELEKYRELKLNIPQKEYQGPVQGK